MALHKAGKTSEKGDDSGRYVFLEHLAKTGYSERKIQDELLNILLAGRDTTASLLAFMFYYLARRPDVWNKLQVEVSKVGNRQPTFDEIKSMKYLQYTMNESKSAITHYCLSLA